MSDQRGSSNISRNWLDISLKECISKIKSGLSRRILEQDIGIPVITSGNLQDGKFDASHLRYWYAKDPQGATIDDYVLDDGDILLNFINSVEQMGKVCIFKNIGRPCIYTTNLFRIKSSNLTTQDFLYFLLSSQNIQQQIKSITKPAINQASFTTGDLLRLEVKLPPFYEQQKVIEPLKAIDRAIATTESLIEKYQKIKAGLMHDLFTRGIGADGKLRPLRDQAPELYQESTIGWIPKDWEFKAFQYGLNASPKNGYSPKEVDTWQGVYVLGLGCLTKNGFIPIQLKKAPRNSLQSGARLEEGDFLISRSNTQELVGLCGIYRDIGHDAIYPDLMMRLKLNQNLSAEFLEQYLLSPAVRQRISAIAVGTSGSMVKINSKTIKFLKIIYPDFCEQIKIVEQLQPVIKQLDCLCTQLEKLKKQKSGLMHDLLTGKVSVKISPDEATYE
ncbi:MAG: restriction endonuclease subunit S [Cyanobacteria bacterium P01_F01_bin.86]